MGNFLFICYFLRMEYFLTEKNRTEILKCDSISARPILIVRAPNMEMPSIPSISVIRFRERMSNSVQITNSSIYKYELNFLHQTLLFISFSKIG